MNVSAKAEYACVAVFELAASYASGEPIQVRRIAEAHGIPAKFLVQILLQLKAAGLVTSTRGACGGYRLARDPADVTVWDVHSIVDGEVIRERHGDSLAARLLDDVWQNAASQSRLTLQSTSFADILAQADSQAMYYI